MAMSTVFLRSVGAVMVRGVKATHQLLFSRYLLASNIGISVAFSIGGDIVAQNMRSMTEGSMVYDLERTKKMGLAAIPVAILCHYWYILLDRQLPAYTMRVVLKKVVIDQVVFSPIMWTAYFAALAVLERSDAKTFADRLWNSGSRLYAAEWAVWPLAQVFNFYFLPTRYRILYDNTISFCFDWYTSYLVNDLEDEDLGELTRTPMAASSLLMT